MKILVVDDEVFTREVCTDLLTDAGYEVETASDGEMALEKLKSSVFPIMLTDIQMPKMDGIQLLKESRKIFPELEVILMTAHGALPSAIEALRMGSYDYLTKPLSSSFLLATIRRCAEKIELQKEIKVFQKKLIDQERLAALGSVSAWLSHRMRNALSVISMCGHYLRGKPPGTFSDDVQEVIRAVVDKTRVLEKVTADLISYSRSYELEKSVGNLNSILETVLKGLAVQFQIQKVKLVQNFDPALPDIQCDSHLLQEVFENLIVNALQAIGKQENQTLFVETLLVQAGTIEARIKNTGSAIPHELQEKIFVPFFTTKESGSGLGLAIVKKIVDEHGGKLGLTSSAEPPLWTQFSLIFPVYETQQPSTVAAKP